jgi:inosose dehydratase
MKLAYHTNTWGGVVGHPAGVTSVKDLYYLANGSTEEAMRDISAAGYDGFELFDGNLMQYEGREDELRRLMEELNLELVGVYSGANFIFPEILDEEFHRIETAARLASSFDVEHLVVGGGAVRASGIREEDYRLLGEGLERVITLAERHGLRASFHPHLGTCVESPEQIAKTFEYTGIDFCPDTAHLEAGGGDSAELIRTYPNRVKYVHLKDLGGGDFLPLGHGDMDLGRILGSLEEIGFDGWIGVELDAYDDPAKGARISKKFLDEALFER